MKEQFDHKRFIVRERFKFWSDMKRKPGETIQELATRIRQDAATCDFPSIKDPQDEALRTRFICSVNNEAVLKALFRVKDDELDFAKAIAIAIQTEEAAKVAKETVYANRPSPSPSAILQVKGKKRRPSRGNRRDRPAGSRECKCCGKTDHIAGDCKYKDASCHYCKKSGHIQPACYQRRRDQAKDQARLTYITQRPVNSISTDGSGVLRLPIQLEGHNVTFEVDTGSRDNFCTKEVWTRLGRPHLEEPTSQYFSATGEQLPIMGRFSTQTCTNNRTVRTELNVTTLRDLNLLGRSAVQQLNIDVLSLLKSRSDVRPILQRDDTLQKACEQVCEEYSDLFKDELGCLKDFELEVQFKSDSKPVFCKPRTVPYAILDSLNHAIDSGIKRGVWELTPFNDYGTPVVPLRKPPTPGQTMAKLRVCGDYSVTVNPQLDTHRHPMPLPEDLMNKLSGGHYFTKIDLADAYNQIQLAPDSQKKLALSTHRGVLLQKRLPFGISSAPGYFQKIMEQLTQDLKGVAVYLDDILVSGSHAEEHVFNLRALLKRLSERGLRCNLKKCKFAQSSVEYLGHILSRDGLSKGSKVDAIINMPAPTEVSSLKSFLGSVQFYGKFLNNLSTLTEPLSRLTKKNVQWRWTADEQSAFQRLKDLLCTDTVLAHFDPNLPLGLSCDASNVGIGAVLFHRYADGSERPIANVSKTLSDTQRRYSQIQKEALAVIFGLKKFHQFLYGRNFILVTDHRPLVSMFSPTKGTPALAANRLARWALTLSQYNYTIEYRRTEEHSNADVLSRLPAGMDDVFDRGEEDDDAELVCAIKAVSQQINPANSKWLADASARDPIISQVIRFVREGWPAQLTDPELRTYKPLDTSLAVLNGCLLNGSRVVIPSALRTKVLELLHLGHFGIQRMKQLARSAVYWPGINYDIEQLSRSCNSCAEFQNKPAKPANHPWMLPEKPWSRLHVDHAIDFMGSHWLVLIDAYTKFPCIHATSSTSSKTTMDLLEEDFALFGYPHAIVSDNSTTFTSEEFQTWCRERGITHLTGAPYHPATNGAAERLVQSFKRALQKSKLSPRKALQMFLMQYRRTPLDIGYSPSELLNSRQIRTMIDTLLPSPPHLAQRKEARAATKSQQHEVSQPVSRIELRYEVGTPCYALYCGPRRQADPRWVPAVVTRVFGTRSVNVRVFPRGPTWRRHIEQLRPRYGVDQDSDPGDPVILEDTSTTRPTATPETSKPTVTRKSDIPPRPKRRNPRLPDGPYGPGNPRRSDRIKL
jgi:transposase InsO family protein